MRDHATCEDAINRALARGQDGRAEYLQTRCEENHQQLPVEEPPSPELPEGETA